MRALLKWALGATVAMSAASLLWPPAEVPIVDAVPRADVAGSPAGVQMVGSVPPSHVPQPVVLPASLPEVAIELARVDIFEPVRPPQPKAMPQPIPSPAPLPQPPVALAPVVTPPPALQIRYLGSFRTPGGQPLLFLARNQSDQPMAVQVGSMLEEGYTVMAIGPGSLKLAHRPTGTEVSVPIPDSAVALP